MAHSTFHFVILQITEIHFSNESTKTYCPHTARFAHLAPNYTTYRCQKSNISHKNENPYFDHCKYNVFDCFILNINLPLCTRNLKVCLRCTKPQSSVSVSEDLSKTLTNMRFQKKIFFLGVFCSISHKLRGITHIM
jgi:hypothetical protein